MTERPSPSGEELLEDLAQALRRRVAERRRAEQRLAEFAFREGPDGEAARTPREPVESEVTDWRAYAARALAALEPAGLALLDALREGPLPLSVLAERLGITDRVIAVDRVGDLAAAGLVARELESDRAALTGLGEAVLALLDDLAARAGTEVAAR